MHLTSLYSCSQCGLLLISEEIQREGTFTRSIHDSMNLPVQKCDVPVFSNDDLLLMLMNGEENRQFTES